MHERIGRRFLVASAVGASLLLGGCGEDGGDTASDTTAASEAAATAAITVTAAPKEQSICILTEAEATALTGKPMKKTVDNPLKGKSPFAKCEYSGAAVSDSAAFKIVIELDRRPDVKYQADQHAKAHGAPANFGMKVNDLTDMGFPAFWFEHKRLNQFIQGGVNLESQRETDCMEVNVRINEQPVEKELAGAKEVTKKLVDRLKS